MTITTTATRTDRAWMERALELARQGEALASPNPMVGAVVVRGSEEIACGYHTYDGVLHAESMALKQAGAGAPESGAPESGARGATLYLNLEPCSHRGRTGPCVEAILEAGVARVVAAMADPNPQVNGRGFERLRAAGVEVTTGLCEEEARELNEAFACSMRLGRPLLTLKAGLTLDGKIARGSLGAPGEHTWITSEESRAQVQRLRHASDAVLSGIGTVLADDPRITDRSGLGRRRPLLRVILDAGLRLPLDSQLVRTAEKDVLVFCGEDVWMGKRKKLEERGVEVVEMKEAGGRISLLAVLHKLAERKISSVLLEAGARLNAAAVEANLVDKVWLFYAPKFLGEGGVPLLAPHFAETVNRAELPRLLRYRLHRFGPDFAVEGTVRDVYGTSM